MTYSLHFHSLDYGPAEELTYYGQSMPLVPRTGERVNSELFGRSGYQFVKDVTYMYSKDLITVFIIVGSEKQ